MLDQFRAPWGGRVGSGGEYIWIPSCNQSSGYEILFIRTPGKHWPRGPRVPVGSLYILGSPSAVHIFQNSAFPETWYKMYILKEETAENGEGVAGRVLGSLVASTRRFLFRVMSVGPIPEHIAFIMDGNRRFAKKWKLEEGAGHKAGFLAMMSLLKYCYELGVKYVTLYAFSIDNFRRRPDEVQYVMDLMHEKIEGFLKEESVVNQYGVRVMFIGDLKLLYEPVRIAAEKAMKATAHNTNTVLLICVAYTSGHEIPRSVDESCKEKWGRLDPSKNGTIEPNRDIKVVNLEKHMYMAVAPDPDILVRSSGETRLSNFLLWQTTNCLLYSPKALWPELGLRHVVWGVLKFQRSYSYLEKKKKQS